MIIRNAFIALSLVGATTVFANARRASNPVLLEKTVDGRQAEKLLRGLEESGLENTSGRFGHELFKADQIDCRSPIVANPQPRCVVKAGTKKWIASFAASTKLFEVLVQNGGVRPSTLLGSVQVAGLDVVCTGGEARDVVLGCSFKVYK